MKKKIKQINIGWTVPESLKLMAISYFVNMKKVSGKILRLYEVR